VLAGLALLPGCQSRFEPNQGGPVSLGGGVTRLGPEDAIPETVGQVLYVPAYSHIHTGNRGERILLAETLSVRNTDTTRPIILKSVRYHDSDGKPLHEELPSPVRLAPLASAEFFVKESDTRGGSGASFLVEWVAEEPVNPPLIEAVMISTAGAQGIAFVRPARVIKDWTRERADGL
jgi:hypothetical protein